MAPGFAIARFRDGRQLDWTRRPLKGLPLLAATKKAACDRVAGRFDKSFEF
jgi:hypothetical protein